MPRVNARRTKSAPKAHRRSLLPPSRAGRTKTASGTERNFLSPFIGRSTFRTSPSGTQQENSSSTQSMSFRKILVFFLVVVVFLLFIFLVRDQRNETLQFGSDTLQLEVVSTDELREKGLSGRESLPNNHAMWFAFDSADVRCFWMKDMNFPIDIIWLNEQRKVVFVKENAQPNSYPESFCPNKPAKYVLEVSAGLTKQKNVTVGSQL